MFKIMVRILQEKKEEYEYSENQLRFKWANCFIQYVFRLEVKSFKGFRD